MDKKTIHNLIGDAIYKVTNEQPLSQTKEIKLLGSNKNDCLILVEYPESEYAPENLLDFLRKIAGALKLNFDETALVNNAGLENSSLTVLERYITFNKVICFGIHPKKLSLHINVQPYTLHKFKEKQFVFSEKLEAIHQDTMKKGQLWNALQHMFELK